MCVVTHLLFIPSQIQNSPVVLVTETSVSVLLQGICSLHTVAVYFTGATLAEEGQWSQLSLSLLMLKLDPGLLGTSGALPICLLIFKHIGQYTGNYSAATEPLSLGIHGFTWLLELILMQHSANGVLLPLLTKLKTSAASKNAACVGPVAHLTCCSGMQTDFFPDRTRNHIN